MYKEALQRKLRFLTAKGSLTLEQLFDLSITSLDTLAVALNDEYEQSTTKSFLVKRNDADRTVKLKLDIVLDILNSKVDEAEAIANKKRDKEHNEKIMALIAEKQDGELRGKSIEELSAMLK